MRWWIVRLSFLPEEQRAHERQLLEIFEGNRLLEQLPLLLKGEEFVDEFSRVREEVMIVVFVSGKKIEKDGIWTIGAEGKYSIEPLVLPQTIVLGLRLARTRNFFGIDQMSCPPIALNESPRASHVNGVPTVPESIVLEANPRLIAGRFAVTLYHHAMQSSITEGKKYRTIWIFAREKLSCSHFPTRFSPILKGKKYGYAFGDELSFWACREKDRNEKELRAFTCTIVWTERGNFQSRVLFLSTSP